MKVLVQRVVQASVEVDNQEVANIGAGLLLLVGIAKEDQEDNLLKMAKKIVNLRIFSDSKGRFHYSLLETEGAVLAVPQFTLFADTSKGRRPEFFSAMPPDKAKPLTALFVEALTLEGIANVESGKFGADMKVSSINDGPVTMMLES